MNKTPAQRLYAIYYGQVLAKIVYVILTSSSRFNGVVLNVPPTSQKQTGAVLVVHSAVGEMRACLYTVNLSCFINLSTSYILIRHLRQGIMYKGHTSIHPCV